MIARRDLLVGLGCGAAAAGSNLLKPRKLEPLLSGGSIADIVPANFGDWQSVDVGDPLAVNGPGTLSAKIYNQLVTRIYANQTNHSQVMTLLAYGGQQTDDLQLHRPEICYPAFGFALTHNEAINLPIVDGVGVPARRLIAQSDDQNESVIYWSRIGEYLPTSSAQQREARLRISLAGIVPDGLLSRFSTVTDDPADAWKVLETFIPALVRAVPAKYRKVLIGSERGRSMMQISA